MVVMDGAAIDEGIDHAGRWPEHVSGEWTVEMLETLPDDGLRYELIDGTLIVSPAPIMVHQRAVVRMLVLLVNVCGPEYEALVAPVDWQPDRHTSLQPDVLVVRKDRIGEKNIRQVLTVAVEVASPGTARYDRLVKFSRYAEGGVQQYWLVDPRVPSIEVYDLADGAYRLTAQARGMEQIVVETPFQVTVAPADLIGG
jgi:Uma2 family endonuclease